MDVEIVTEDGILKRTKKFVESHVGEIMTVFGGICILASAILNANEGNSYIYTTATDGTVFKVRAKKEKTIKNK